jgi:replicative DNA helicase
MSRDSDHLPHSFEAEKAVLGAILLDPGWRDELGVWLGLGDFYDARCKRVYRAMLQVDGEAEIVAVQDQLEQTGKLAQAGGPAFLAKLIEGLPTAARAEHYAKIVSKHARRREGMALFAKATEQIDKGEPAEVLASVRQALQRLEQRQPQRRLEPLKVLTADELLSGGWPEPVWAIPSLLPVGPTILAGKPKIGKSFLCLQIAQAVAAGGTVLG